MYVPIGEKSNLTLSDSLQLNNAAVAKLKKIGKFGGLHVSPRAVCLDQLCDFLSTKIYVTERAAN